jgi:cation-dependent mannose-6-phosphate receptor
MITSPSHILMLLATAAVGVNAAVTATITTPAPACTATSLTSGGFFDLRPDTAIPLKDEKSHKSGVIYKDYHSRGYDYGKNFTLNICGAVVDPVSDVVGLKESQWVNVSAYYTSHDSVYSIGFV